MQADGLGRSSAEFLGAWRVERVDAEAVQFLLDWGPWHANHKTLDWHNGT